MPIELAEPAPGFLATEWMLAIELAFVAGMILIAAMRKRLVDLLWSSGTCAWIGGLLVFTSTFFVDAIGPWGVKLSPYAALTWHWGFPQILYSPPRLTPQFFGFVVWMAAFLAAVMHRSLRVRVQCWIVGASIAA